MYFEPQTHRIAINRIHRLSGRFPGLEKMLLPNDAYDILVQLMAMQGSFKRLSSFMHDAFLMDANIKLHTPLPVVLQTPEMLKHIENTKMQLTSCTPQQLLQIMHMLKRQKNIC